MKKNAKLGLNRETLRILNLDGPSLRRVVGATSLIHTRCAESVCGSCPVYPSGNSGCNND